MAKTRHRFSGASRRPARQPPRDHLGGPQTRPPLPPPAPRPRRGSLHHRLNSPTVRTVPRFGPPSPDARGQLPNGDVRPPASAVVRPATDRAATPAPPRDTPSIIM